MSGILHISLEEASAGMQLAEDLLDTAGHVLLPKGAELSAATLVSLSRRGIEHLAVEIPDAPEDVEGRREAMRQRLLQVFRRSGDDPTTRALLHAILEHREKSSS